MAKKEYIERVEALRYIEWYMLMKEKNYDNPTITLDEVTGLLTEIPASDAVEVTRCKDCTYRDGQEDLCGNIYCRLHDGRFDKDGYCSYGKREVD